MGVFFAPAIFMFAFSGALQTFSLHENKGGGPYQPPAWIVALANIHKDQVLLRPKPPKPPKAAAGAAAPAPDHDHDADADHDEDAPHDHDADAAKAEAPKAEAPKSDAKADAPRAEASKANDAQTAGKPKRPYPLAMKIFVLLLSIGLMGSSVVGVWIALQMRQSRKLTLILLAAGTIIPIALLFV